jgi:hypothetical protein
MKLSDALTLLGLAFITAGAGIAYLPLGIALAGIFMLLVGIGLSGKKDGSVDR